jgi:hypothetical protein
MSRTDKLYQRLDQTEADYTALLRKEIEAVLDGGLGNYLGSKLCDDWYQRISGRQDDRTALSKIWKKSFGA